MPSKYLAKDDRIIRYVPWARVRKDEDDNVVGILGNAFHLRANEDYLSVTWCEYFDGDEFCKIRCAAEAIRNSEIDVRPKGRFAIAEVKSVNEFMLEAKRTVRFIHERESDNPAHAAIRRWPNDAPELLERLAEDVWHQSYSKTDIDAITECECLVSLRGAQAP